jgi:putative membrane protein
MFGSEFYGFHIWWIFPILMIVLCILMMRGRMGCMMGGHDSHGTEDRNRKGADSPLEILAQRYARGEIDTNEYEEKKRVLTEQSDLTE